MPESMKKRLGEMLVDEGIISEEQLQEAMHEQKIKGGRLEKILISQGYVTQDVIMAFVGTQLGIPAKLDRAGPVGAASKRPSPGHGCCP